MSWPAPTGEPVNPNRDPSGAPAPFPDSYPARPQMPGAETAQAPGMHQPAHVPAAAPGAAPASVPSGGASPDVTSGPVAGGQLVPSQPGHIDTLAPLPPQASGLAPLSPRTGQPVRPWTVWASAALLFGGAIVVIVGLLLAMWEMASPWQQVGENEWNKVDKFNEATWLTAQFPSEPASGMRVFFAIACCLLAVLVAGSASAIGYYAFAGYRWTRIGALVALGVSLLSLSLTPIAAISIGFVALGAAPLWLPATSRFFARWQLVRHPQISYSEPIDQVFYGPLPRYR